MDGSGGDCRMTNRERKANMLQNDGWQKNYVARPRGASDAQRKGETPNLSELARWSSCHIRRPGKSGLLLSGFWRQGPVFLLWRDFKTLGGWWLPNCWAFTAFPQLQIHSGSGCGQYSTSAGILRFCGWPAVEPASENDHGWPRNSRTSSLSWDGSRGFSPHHLPQLALWGLHPARCSCQCWILLHRYSMKYFRSKYINKYNRAMCKNILNGDVLLKHSAKTVIVRVSGSVRAHRTIVSLSHQVVSRTTWTELSPLKLYNLMYSAMTHCKSQLPVIK